MITAVHLLVFANDPVAAREFLRDVLGWPCVDAHDGWLVFKTGPSELGVHPTSGGEGVQAWSTPEHHEIWFMCDDLAATVAELKAKGAEFEASTGQASFGLTAAMKVPGAANIMLYQPRHPVAHGL